MERLINDKRSLESPLNLQDPPTSLLNSQRMYLQLLKAFDEMDRDRRNGPYVDELDVYVTATDIQGVALPIRLADDVVYERRHRNVLHLVYSKSKVSGADKDRNDFAAEYNPFLAYAARCTSAFPFAFEPMCLCDTDALLDRLPAYRAKENCKSDSRLWQPFFRDYLDPRGVSTVPFPKRSFGDGGYLDNKPFTYATSALMRRHAGVPVDRKLIYIEPSPEHPQDQRESEQKPDAIANVTAAVLTLPRYETVREDLERIIERNRMIERVNRVINGVEQDAEHAHHLGALSPLPANTDEPWAKSELTESEWATLDLGDMIKRKGRGYAAYHRLEIEAVTDQLAELIARVARFDEQSDYFLIIRSLVDAWRKRAYVEYHNQDGKLTPTMNDFLFSFNLPFPLRRISFLRIKIDQLYRLDDQARELIALRVKGFWEHGTELADHEKDKFRQELLRVKRTLNKVYISLRHEGRLLRSRQPPPKSDTIGTTPVSVSPLYEDIMNLIQEIRKKVLDPKKKSSSPILDYFLGTRKKDEPTLAASVGEAKSTGTKRIEEECVGRATDFLDEYRGIGKLFDKTAEVLRNELRPHMDRADKECREMLRGSSNTSPDEDDATLTARSVLFHYYENYDEYDMMTFPILYGTDVGEADIVEIIRISPEDAKALIDERDTGCRKLAGTTLSNFGAFLEEGWRKNDILWGRLDGAERIITALLPNHPQTGQLIGEAQAAIIHETIENIPEEGKNLLIESFMRTKTRKPDEKALIDFIRKLKGGATDPEIKRSLDNRINEHEIGKHYQDSYEKRSHLKPKPTLRSAARATTVIGKMLSGISAEYNVNDRYVAWVARLGQISLALVEVAVPSSLPNLIFHHWLKLLYFFEVVLIIGSTLLVAQPVQQFAFTAFALTLGIHLAVLILGDLMRSKKRWLNVIKALLGVAVVTCVVVGVLSLSAILGFGDPIWKTMVLVRNWFAEPLSPG